jgi:hypothetical protein
MTIDITTPSAGTWLYAPTRVSSDASGIHIDVFPSSGLLPVIGSLRETVTLGAFPVGFYNYEVVIHPEFQVGWGIRTNRGSFTVMGETSLPPVHIVASAPETLEPSPNTRVAPGEFTITRLGDTNEALLLFVQFSGTATFGQDYQEVSPYLVMPAGATKLSVLVGPLDDSLVEGDETVIATLSTNPPINSLPNYTVHPRLNRATVVIHDNDFPNELPVVSISGPSTVLESCPPNADCVGLYFTLRRTGPGLDQPLYVFIRYRGTATAGVDYEALPAPVTFEAGRDTLTVSSVPIDDTLYEGDETIVAEVLPLTTYDVDPNRWQATTVLRDNDPPAPPVVSLELVTRDAAETRIDQNAIFWGEFRVLRTGPVTNELVVFLSTQGSARLGEDYRLERVNDGSTVRFLPGERFVNVRLFPIDDDSYEGDETVVVRLTEPPFGSPLPAPYTIDVAHSSVEMIIHDNDRPEPPLVWIETIDSATSEPYDTGVVVPGKFLVHRSGPTNGPLRVFLQYGGTASNGVDYRELPRFVEIPASWPFATVLDVVALADTFVEGKETVEVKVLPGPPEDFPLLIPIQEYRVDANRQSGRVIIFDRQTPLVLPTVSIEATLPEARECAPNENCPISRGRLTIRRMGELDYPLPVHVAFEGTATRGADYGIVLPDSARPDLLPRILMLPPGQSRFDLLISPIDDQLAEGDKTATLRLLQVAIDTSQIFPPLDYHVDADHASATVVIHDNDPLGIPVVSIEPIDTEAAETLISQNFMDLAQFRISRTGRLDRELLVFLNLQQGSARQGVDYRLEGIEAGSTVRIRPGESSATVWLFPIDDELYEGDEYAFFHLIAPPSGSDPYETDFPHSSIRIVLHDNDPVTTRLEITSPRDGEHFQAGEVIQLRNQIIGPGSTNSWIVEFFDGEQSIGTTRPGGAIWWDNAIGGPHVISARAANPAGATLAAPPVTIFVGPGPAWPVVSITSGWPGKTMEPCPVCFVPAAYFTVSRTGPTKEALKVYLEYDGPATPGQDYQELPHQVIIPPGTNAAHVPVLAFEDRLVEGPEIVRATIALPELATLGYIASYYANQAMVVIADDEAGAPEIRLDIAEPDEGAQFAAGITIKISALGVWTRGEVDRPVEFFAGDRFIGQSDPPQLLRPTIPCLPSVHTVFWTNPPQGRHTLTARFDAIPGLAVTSPPVNIVVGPEPPRTRVRIEATQRLAEEDSLPFDRVPFAGVFTISRTGPTNASLPVYVQYSGSARAGEDYPVLPWVVTLPAGATSTQIRVVPSPDNQPEGIETLVATISNCPPPWLRPPCYDFDIEPARASATVFIRDDGVTQASLAITNPKDGANFNVGETILIEATAIDLDGYISRVEFWDRDQRIGESEIVFIRAPDPGTPIHHSFEWRGATTGSQVLTARATAANGTGLISQPVRITVGPVDNQPPRVAITRPASGAEFPLDAAIEIVAETRDPDGYVRRVEFFADGRKIGESSVEFIRPPDPGQLQRFTFVWRRATPGPHALSARATDDDGATGTSALVEIRVATSEPLPIVTVTAPDPFAVEPRANADVNTATFRIRRFGLTNEGLFVNYSLHGTAENGADYERLSGSTVIPAGRRFVTVTVRPLPDDLAERIETVILRLEEPPPVGLTPEVRPLGYRVGRPGMAVALISDQPWRDTPGGAQCLVLPGRLLHLCFAAEAGHNFRVEASPDLRNWETLFDTVSRDGAWHFIDTDMENHPRRFYRLTPEPVAEVDE